MPLLLILAVTGFVVAARRSDAAWAHSYGAFLKLALLIIAVRIVFQSLLSSGSQGPTVLFTLPEVPVAGSTGLKLGGVVSLEAVLRAFYEGLQLATILCCVGAANSLGSARRLLRSVPGRSTRSESRWSSPSRSRPSSSPTPPGSAPPTGSADRAAAGCAPSSAWRCRCSRVPWTAPSSWPRPWTPGATGVRRTPAASRAG